MARYAYNPFTGNFDRVGDGGGGGAITEVTADNAGATVFFDQLGTIANLEVSDINGNTIIGEDAGNGTLSGINNTGVGFQALLSLTTGSYNNAFGRSALQSLQDGLGNTAIGFSTLSQNISGIHNTAIGMQALEGATGSANIGIGFAALGSPGAFTNSIGIGYQSLFALTSGTGNVALGILTLNSLVNGSFNTVIGNESGQNYNAGESGNIILGNFVSGIAGEDNITRIGNGQLGCYISGIAGISVPTPEAVTIDPATGQMGSTPLSANPLLSANITLTSTQIKNLHASPITIIPAPGANKMVVAVSLVGKFNYGTTPFTAIPNQGINLFAGTNKSLGTLMDSVYLNSTNDFNVFNPPQPFLDISANLENQPITLYNAEITEITGNATDDTTVDVYVQYYVASF